MQLTSAQLAGYRRDGCLLVPDMFAPAVMDRALAAMERIFYGESFAAWSRAHAAGERTAAIPDGIARIADGRRTRWPVGEPALDRLIENEALLTACAELLGDQPFYCGALLFLRCGPTDARHPDTAWSGWHFDHYNNGLLPPSPAIGRYEYLNAAVYLHDVDSDSAPTLLLPGTHRRATELAARALADGNFKDGTFTDVRRLGDLPRPVPATGRRGTVLFYSSSLVHAAQPFGDRSRQRAIWTLSVARRDCAAWCRHVDPFGYGEREFTRVALALTTPRVRTLLGWPPPGDAYWTEATIDLTARTFEGIDLTAYRWPRCMGE